MKPKQPTKQAVVRISITLPGYLADWLKAETKREGITLSELVCRIVERYLSYRQRDGKKEDEKK